MPSCCCSCFSHRAVLSPGITAVIITVCILAGEAAWGGCKQQQRQIPTGTGSPCRTSSTQQQSTNKAFLQMPHFSVLVSVSLLWASVGFAEEAADVWAKAAPGAGLSLHLKAQKVMAGVAPALPMGGSSVQCCQVRKLKAFPGKEMGGLGTRWEGLAHVGTSKEQTWQD